MSAARALPRRIGAVDAGLIGGHLLLVAAIPARSPWLFLAAGLWVTGAELAAGPGPSWLRRLLNGVLLGPEARGGVRELLFLLLLRHTPGQQLLCVAGLLLLRLLRVPSALLVSRVRRVRKLPVATRNIDMSGLRIADLPVADLADRDRRVAQLCTLAGTTGALLAAGTGNPAFTLPGLGLMLAGAVGWCLALLPHWRAARRTLGRAAALGQVQHWLDEYRPRNLVFFAGARDSGYQLEMWLETLARLEGRTAVLLKEQHVLDRLGPTALPVLCLPNGAELMELDWSCVRVVLYPANVGANIQTLRLHTARHVFIGHGDSDKSASVNPFTRVYDEVWTAGQAGADRYARAGTGVRQEQIVQVGRPQLGAVGRGPRRAPGSVRTVLYAPTWEGWTEDPGNTSLLSTGELLVRRLLAAPEPVRVIYRPHAFTGLRDPRMKAADARIRRLLSAAGQKAGQPAGLPEDPELVQVRAELAALMAGWLLPGRDEAGRTRDARLTPAQAQRVARLRDRRAELVWASGDPAAHRIAVGEDYRLYDCFDQADALVADISSVVSDFMACGRPCAIVDAAGIGEPEFRRRNTAAGAALLLGPDASGTEYLLSVVRAEVADNMAGARARVREYLIGPEQPSSMRRFQAALDDLASRAEAGRVPRQSGEAAVLR